MACQPRETIQLLLRTGMAIFLWDLRTGQRRA